MIFLKKRNEGFTIVELLIVIVVIGILALLVITTYSGIQQKARNGQRTSDIKSIRTNLEAFYTANSYYPSLANLNSSSWLSSNLKSLGGDALVDPSNATQSKTLASSPAAKQYAYQPLNSAGTSCEADSTTCAKFTLTATYEGQVNGSSTYAVVNQDGS